MRHTTGPVSRDTAHRLDGEVQDSWHTQECPQPQRKHMVGWACRGERSPLIVVQTAPEEAPHGGVSSLQLNLRVRLSRVWTGCGYRQLRSIGFGAPPSILGLLRVEVEPHARGRGYQVGELVRPVVELLPVRLA